MFQSCLQCTSSNRSFQEDKITNGVLILFKMETLCGNLNLTDAFDYRNKASNQHSSYAENPTIAFAYF